MEFRAGTEEGKTITTSVKEKGKGFASIRVKNWGIIGPPGPICSTGLWRFPEVKIQLGRLKLHKLRSRMSQVNDVFFVKKREFYFLGGQM